MQPRFEEAESAFEHGRRAGDAVSGKSRGSQCRMCCPPAVHALDGAAGAVRLDDSRRHRRSDSESVDDLRFRCAADDGSCYRSTHGAADRRRVLTVFEEHRVLGLGVETCHADPDTDFQADRYATNQRSPVGAVLLGRGQGCRYDGGARVQDRGQVGIVEVERMRQHAVDECSHRTW